MYKPCDSMFFVHVFYKVAVRPTDACHCLPAVSIECGISCGARGSKAQQGKPLWQTAANTIKF